MTEIDKTGLIVAMVIFGPILLALLILLVLILSAMALTVSTVICVWTVQLVRLTFRCIINCCLRSKTTTAGQHTI